MIFNTHSGLEGKHAFLSPSKYHWINYDSEKLKARYISASASRHGTDLHDFAQRAIDLGIRLPDDPRTLNMYINDAINFKMATEQPLYYSPNCFGHVDAIAFRKEILRIHDLKTGTTKASHNQLKVYAAIFCLEYKIDPGDIKISLRIYQNDDILEEEPLVDEILNIMDVIVRHDEEIEQNLRENYGNY